MNPRNDGRRAIDKQRAVQHYSDQHRIAELEKDAERFRALQNMSHIDAQAFFWTYSSRKQRAKAIDEYITASKLETQP